MRMCTGWILPNATPAIPVMATALAVARGDLRQSITPRTCMCVCMCTELTRAARLFRARPTDAEGVALVTLPRIGRWKLTERRRVRAETSPSYLRLCKSKLCVQPLQPRYFPYYLTANEILNSSARLFLVRALFLAAQLKKRTPEKKFAFKIKNKKKKEKRKGKKELRGIEGRGSKMEFSGKNMLERIHTLTCGKTFLLMALLRETKKLYAFSGGYYY